MRGRHAIWLDIPGATLRDRFGWDTDTIADDIGAFLDSGCPEPGCDFRPVVDGDMSERIALAHITLDIVDPALPPSTGSTPASCANGATSRRGNGR